MSLPAREERLESNGWTIMSKHWPSLGVWTASAVSKHGALSGYEERPTREEAREAVVDWAEEMQALLEPRAHCDTERAPAMETAAAE